MALFGQVAGQGQSLVRAFVGDELEGLGLFEGLQHGGKAGGYQLLELRVRALACEMAAEELTGVDDDRPRNLRLPLGEDAGDGMRAAGAALREVAAEALAILGRERSRPQPREDVAVDVGRHRGSGFCVSLLTRVHRTRRPLLEADSELRG